LHADYLASVEQNEALKLKLNSLEQEIALLKEQTQLLQLRRDGYQGYQNLRECKNIVGLGCLSHARRKFCEVVRLPKIKMALRQRLLYVWARFMN
jgi:hypothetical protein